MPSNPDGTPQTANGGVSQHGSGATGQTEAEYLLSQIRDVEPLEMITALGVFDPDRVFASALDIDFQDQWWIDELDSAIGGGPGIEHSAVSLRSSIYGTVEENGRTYHRYKEGKYFLPNDDPELDRLDLQHALYKHTLHDRLYLAPIGQSPQRVLDIGTGTGIWAIDFATLHPNSDILGTDLSPIQPEFVPPNCRFEIDDAEDEWTFPHRFDFIHGRTLLTCFSDPASVIAKAYDGLVPGGYLEMQDIVMPMKYVGNAPIDSAIYKWNFYVVEASVKAQRPWTHVKDYHRYFRDAGFEDVQEFKYLWPNRWLKKGKYFKTLARYFNRDLHDGLEGLSMKLFTNFLGWSRKDVLDLAAAVRKDLQDPAIQTYVQISVVYGRKPKSVTVQVNEKYNKLANKHVLIIDGSSGIGYAVAEASLSCSASITISSSSVPRIESAIKSLQASYPKSQIRRFPCDLSKPSLEQDLAQLFENVGRVDHIVFTAGDPLATIPLEDATLETIHKAGQVRFFAPLLVAKIGRKYLGPGPECSITITTGSVAERPRPNWSIVAAYASGLHGMVRNLALDLKPIRVNLVQPGVVDTPLWRMGREEKEGMFEWVRGKVPTGSVAGPEEVAEAYLWLMKDWNVTGTVATSDSGAHLV